MRILYFIGQLFLLPHILVFLFSKEKEAIVADVYARREGSKKGWVVLYDLSFLLLTNRYFRTLFYHRTRGVSSKVLRIFYPKHSSFTIDRFTVIGPGLQLAHPYSTILNAEKIGAGVYVNHLVTVGEKNGQRPIIEDHVQLHAGCIVIGGITISKNAIIGAGAVVTKNVPENAIAVGNPARIIQK